MRIIIVGAGIMGLSLAWALARAGHVVAVYEQGAIPNPLGSSVDQHRLIRHAYGRHRGYAAMVDPAFAAWERLWADLGQRLYVETGTLAIGRPDQDWLNASLATASALGHAHEELDAASLTARYPLLRAEPDDRAFHMPSGGVLLAGRIIEALGSHLPSRRVTIEPHQPVRAIDPDRGQATLGDGRVVAGDALVVAAGPWTDRLLPDLAPRALPSRQVAVYLAPPAETAEAWAAMPMVLDIDPASGFYLVPPVAGTGMKIGDHSFSLTGDPDRDRDAGETEIAAIARKGAARLAGFERYRALEGRTCFYTVAPEERFTVAKVGSAAWAMAGFSGHGFKFGPLLGLALARALEGGLDADRLGRWAAGHDSVLPEGLTP
ncbi:MAG: FAD-dependent oxidoreductase [Azospirillaceae bacterium]